MLSKRRGLQCVCASDGCSCHNRPSEPCSCWLLAAHVLLGMKLDCWNLTWIWGSGGAPCEQTAATPAEKTQNGGQNHSCHSSHCGFGLHFEFSQRVWPQFAHKMAVRVSGDHIFDVDTCGMTDGTHCWLPRVAAPLSAAPHTFLRNISQQCTGYITA